MVKRRGGGVLKQISRVKTITKYLVSLSRASTAWLWCAIPLPVSKPHKLGHWDKTLGT